MTEPTGNFAQPPTVALQIRRHLRNHPLRSIGLFLLGVALYCAFFQFFYVWMRYGAINAYPTVGSVFSTYLMNFIPLGVIWFVTGIVVFLPDYKSGIGMRGIVSFLICMLSLVLINYLFMEITRQYVDWAGTFFNSFLIFLINYAFYIELVHRNAEKIKREALEQLHEYQDRAFLNQFKPHFLFNSFNILYSMLENTPTADTKKFVMSLSNIYRYILDNMDTTLIELEKEVVFLKDYLHILSLRYDAKLRVHFTGSPRGGMFIVPFSMQLLVENTVKHNRMSRNHPMEVTIAFSTDAVTISNPILPIEKSSTGNVESKHGLTLLTDVFARYEKEISVIADGNTFEVKLPYIKS